MALCWHAFDRRIPCMIWHHTQEESTCECAASHLRTHAVDLAVTAAVRPVGRHQAPLPQINSFREQAPMCTPMLPVLAPPLPTQLPLPSPVEFKASARGTCRCLEPAKSLQGNSLQLVLQWELVHSTPVCSFPAHLADLEATAPACIPAGSKASIHRGLLGVGVAYLV